MTTATKKRTAIQVDPQLQSLIPPLTPEEFKQLERNIQADGCRDPLVVWTERDILLDGHNRLAICDEHDIYFNVVHYTLPDYNAASAWIINNQFGRRNLTPYQRAELALKLEPLIAMQAKEKLSTHTEQGYQKSDKAVHTLSEVARAAGLSHDTIHKAKVIQQKADEQTKEMLRAGETSINKVYSEIKGKERRQERIDRMISETAPDLNGTGRKYAVIYADPPWRYEHSKTTNREIENHYPTMTLEEICDLPVGEVAYSDSILFLWATSPKVAEAIRVIASWGFTYRTCMVWVKDKIGMGYYARQRHELLLIATRGNLPVPEPFNRPDSVQSYPRTQHSAKPKEFYDIIESMYPEMSKIEMFAREDLDGWDSWGNQINSAGGGGKQ